MMDEFLDQFLSTQQWQEVGMNRALAGIALDSFSAMELPKLTALTFSHSESEPFHHNRSTLYNTGGTQVQNDEMISHLSYQRMLVDRVNQRVQQGGGQLLVSNSSFNPMGKSIEEEDMPNLLASSSLAFDSSTKFQQSLSSGTLVGPNWHHSFINSSGFPDPIALGQFKSESFPASTEVLGKRSRQEDDDEEDEADQDMMNQSQSQSQGQGQGQIQTTTSVDVVPKPRLRARRGQATDPHSIAERNRRERISERLKALQVLVPDANKTDKASMLDEIIGYVRFLQMQVKCLSVCRLGGSGMAASLIADLPVDGSDNPLTKGCNMPKSNGSSQDAMEYAEWQVARLMDEDMSAAMQYLQNKGLCLMPISLATAISTTTTTATAKHQLFSHLSHESLESCTGQEPPLHAIPTPINMPKEDAN